jgi:hypothetical protein
VGAVAEATWGMAWGDPDGVVCTISARTARVCCSTRPAASQTLTGVRFPFWHRRGPVVHWQGAISGPCPSSIWSESLVSRHCQVRMAAAPSRRQVPSPQAARRLPVGSRSLQLP